MCDYSLHNVKSRPAKVGDKLASTKFTTSITHGFAAPANQTSPYVCFRAQKSRSRTRWSTGVLGECFPIARL